MHHGACELRQLQLELHHAGQIGGGSGHNCDWGGGGGPGEGGGEGEGAAKYNL